LTIQLTSAPKIIHFIKQWIPNVFLVGFKLLINSSDKELVAAAMNNITQHHCDLVVANNLASLQQGTHEILLIEPNGSYTKHTHHLAPAIMAHVLQRGKK
jgi:hypothetical protein